MTFTVHPSRLSFHGLDMALATEPGTFTFRIGGSSLDPNVREATVELTGDTASYDRRSIIATAVDIS